MRPLMILLAILICATGCSETDEPLKPTDQTPEQTDQAGYLPAPEKADTVILQLVSYPDLIHLQFAQDEKSLTLPSENSPMIVPISKNFDDHTEVFVVDQGILTKKNGIFQEEIYQFIWAYLDEKIVLLSILDNEIRYISDEEDQDQFDWDKWDRMKKEEFAKPNPRPDLNTHIHATLSKKPFFLRERIDAPGDKIEVKIKHRFTYPYKYIVPPKAALHQPTVAQGERDILFVDVISNVTRPHIKY